MMPPSEMAKIIRTVLCRGLSFEQTEHILRVMLPAQFEAGLQELEAGDPEVWDTLTRQFEAQLIQTALDVTRGRRIEAAHKLGIGRNTITRKIQELNLDQ